MPTPTLRPARPDDAEILFRIFVAARGAELSRTGLVGQAFETLLRVQSSAQERSWDLRHPRLERSLVSVESTPVGRFYVDRSGPEICLVDVALLAPHRGKGLGKQLLRRLVAEADAARKSIVLHVDRDNPARHLYARHGFVVTGEDQLRHSMRRKPHVGGGR